MLDPSTTYRNDLRSDLREAQREERSAVTYALALRATARILGPPRRGALGDPNRRPVTHETAPIERVEHVETKGKRKPTRRERRAQNEGRG
jgi:hypothetical protein